MLLSGLAPDALARYLDDGRDEGLHAADDHRARRSSSASSRACASEGYALDVEEYAENLCCISVPVRDPNSGAIVAAISLAMPKIRFRRSLVPRWRSLLEEKAALISPQLGLIGTSQAPSRPPCSNRPSSSARC